MKVVREQMIFLLAVIMFVASLSVLIIQSGLYQEAYQRLTGLLSNPSVFSEVKE